MASYILWTCMIVLFFCNTFGLYTLLMLIFALIALLLGIFSLLYVEEGHIENFYKSCASNPLTSKEVSEGGLNRIISNFSNLNKRLKLDRRVTGSEVIDASLQEILGYVIRDYVLPWYTVITNDEDFPDLTVKNTAQSLAINISNRIKEVDWIPYLTTRLVDDGASHLKLFKQACYRIEQFNKFEQHRDSPSRDGKYNSKKSHKRTKSEADVSLWNVKENEGAKRDQEKSKLNTKEPDKTYSLEDYFFDLECQMENKLLCRDYVCMNSDKEKEYLLELTELLLYLLLPDEDFQCKPVQYLLREILVNCIFLPLFNMICDPDFINQSLIWLCFRENTTLSEIFITSIRMSNNALELKYSKELVTREIQTLRSRDCGGENDMIVKQQLSSLAYVKKLIDNRLQKLDNMEILVAPSTSELETIENVKIKLPLDVVLKNNIALSYFIDYVSKTDCQSYLFFYLNVEGWRISVEQQLSDLHLNKFKNPGESASHAYDNIRATALNIFEQYLSEKDEHKVQLPSSLVQGLFFRVRNLTEQPSEFWFDEVREAVYKKMQEEILPQFYYSKTYLRLLEELDLLQYHTADEDSLSFNSLEIMDSSGDEKLNSLPSNNTNKGENRVQQLVNSKDTLNPHCLENNSQKATKHARSFSDITDFNIKNEDDNFFESNHVDDCINNENENTLTNLKNGPFTLEARIIETGIVCEKGKTFGVYAIHVKCTYDSGFIEEWHIYRRYSDFYDLQQRIKEKFPNLSKLPFPGKKTFHNMERSVLEKRMQMLGFYIKQLCRSDILSAHYGLQNLLMTFLEQGDYDKVTSGGPISHTIDTIVNPFKSGIKTIKNVPEQFINTVDEVVEGITKVFQTKNQNQESCKVGASLDTESADNIPLRIMLLLMDEVFDLKSRNQWLRRRIVALLRQIIHAMFGDIVNKKILDYVSLMTSPKNVAHYLQSFKQSFWPNGKKVEKRPERDEAIRFRTRVAAKVALLSCLSDELKHIIGSETTRRGLLTVFELFQKPILNRRLLYVLLEGIICTLFSETNMNELFQKFHSKSKRLNLQS